MSLLKSYKTSVLIFAMLIGIYVFAHPLAFTGESGHAMGGSGTKDSIVSVKAFNDVYKVLLSPRCVNCHPKGEIPLQGDDSHLHTMLPKRGKDGKGLYAMKCGNCHQPANTAGQHTPPGHIKWQLPPANMKMVFEGRTPHQLAKQLLDPKQNGNKDLQKLLAHADDGLVKAAWNPGDGRTLPPLGYFKRYDGSFKKKFFEIGWLERSRALPWFLFSG